MSKPMQWNIMHTQICGCGYHLSAYTKNRLRALYKRHLDSEIHKDRIRVRRLP